MAAILSVLSTSTYKLPSIHRSHAASSFRMCYHTTTTTTRRSGNYGPPTWDFNYIQSLNTTTYTGERFVTRRDELKERFVTRRDELKEKVKDMLNNEEMKEVEKMEMIDELQRLGCSYHFEEEIMAALMDIYMKKKKKSSNSKDLYATALEFRLLRQNGFNIFPDVFDGFMDGKRSGFNASLCEDTKGLLNLYESSFLSMEGETSLELGRDFSAKHLKHELKLPLHWRMPRLEARGFIDSYDKGKTTSNPILLELAKLDFNIVQAVHLEDLRFVSRWDDVTKVEHLPDYMRLCYLALNNFVNEVAYDILKQHGIFILHHLRKSWADLCKAYLQEAKWYHSGYTPTYQEYIETAWI